ncbi:RNA polymerase sigma factor [Bacillus sp. DNRA2]|uniref:RNA polymerase sigma factor n=1 Tax=Bacillus sp. DNRA2 TaxID=2723053 RepID=UPI00145E568B|nr:RNA polymerase sigma factor [Bacillus sp. DNRA2]NMD70441.1 RNA polymerase sigma factor [Bacillus sp. DNRA2]
MEIALDFNQLYSMYSKRLYFTAFKIVHDHHLAEDIVQETFLKAYKKMETIDDVSKVAAWLNAISARTAIDFLRSKQRKNYLVSDHTLIESVLYESNCQNQTEDEVSQHFFEQELNDSMADLSKEYKEVLELKINHGLKEQEIATFLQLKPTTVKNRLYRARKKLIARMAEKYIA